MNPIKRIKKFKISITLNAPRTVTKWYEADNKEDAKIQAFQYCSDSYWEHFWTTGTVIKEIEVCSYCGKEVCNCKQIYAPYIKEASK